MDGYRIGHGYDIHRVSEDRPLLLGGLSIPGAKGLVGHSDADVLLHALCDALLGAAGLGDIGDHFSDTDPAYKGVSSRDLVEKVVEKLAAASYGVVNVDLTVVLEAPRLGPLKEQIRVRIAEMLDVEPERVNVKAKTMEGLGPLGKGRAMAAHAVALLERKVG